MIRNILFEIVETMSTQARPEKNSMIAGSQFENSDTSEISEIFFQVF